MVCALEWIVEVHMWLPSTPSNQLMAGRHAGIRRIAEIAALSCLNSFIFHLVVNSKSNLPHAPASRLGCVLSPRWIHTEAWRLTPNMRRIGVVEASDTMIHL